MLLVIDRQQTQMRYQAGVLRIKYPGEKTKTIPLKLLKQVVVYGNPLIDAGVWRALAGENITAVLLAQRGRHTVAFVGVGLTTSLPLRRMQFQCAEDSQQSVQMARFIISQKFKSYCLPLDFLAKNFGLTLDNKNTFQQVLTEAQRQLVQANTINSIMGLEGSIAAKWFALLSQYLDETWQFTQRNRQPPRDPINALLSLGYTLMLSETRHALLSAGFDPAFGFLHQPYPAREALALDLLESFRANIDTFVLHCVYEQRFQTTDFYYRDTEGCRLSKSARPQLYQAWAQWQESSPRPFQTLNVDTLDWETAPLRELINGQVNRFREQLKELTA
jgi:CRISPR-associated protein Cas1